MEVGEGFVSPVIVEQVLQTKSPQLFKLPLMPEHRLCTHFLQPRQRIEFAPMSFIHTPQGCLTDAIFDFVASCLEIRYEYNIETQGNMLKYHCKLL